MSFARAALRVSTTIVATAALAVVFVVSLVVAVLLHLGTPPARRIVARELPVLLDGAFPGKLRVHALTGLSVYGVGGIDIDLVHPDGAVVARLRGVEATLDPIRAVKALWGRGPIEIPIRSVAIRDLELDVTTRGGNLRIADVFVDPNEPPTPDDPDARALDLHIREITVRHAWAHGRIEADGPVIDADLDELLAGFALDDTTTRVGLTRVDVVTRQAPRGADLRGRISAAFDMTSEPSADRPAQSAFYFVHGTVARSPISSIGILKGEAVHAWLWLPEVSPQQVREVVPEAPPIAAPVGLTAVVDGTFHHLGGRVLVAAGQSRIDVKADAALAAPIVATASFHATNLDAALVGGPASDVSLEAEGRVEVPEAGEPRGRASLATAPGVVAGIPVPAVVGSGTFAGGAAHAELDVREPGMRAAVVADLVPGPRGSIVDARLDIPRAELAALKRRGFEASGQAEVSATAHVDLGAQTLAASMKLAASNLSAAKAAPGVSVGSVQIDARAAGPLANPMVNARAFVRAAAVEKRAVSWASVAVDGPAMHPLVVAEVSSLDFPHVRARSRVDVRGGPALDDVEVQAERGTTRAKLSVRHVVIGPGIPTLRDVRIDGLGETMTMSITPENGRGMRVVAKAPRISIPAVNELAGLELGVREGRVRFDTDVLLETQRFEGKLDLHVQDVDIRRAGVALDDLDCSVTAEIRGRDVRFSVDSETTALGSMHVRSTRTIELAGPPADLASWRDAVGAFRVDGDVRLASVARLVPADRLPVQDVEGRLIMRGEVARDEKRAAPSLDLTLETRELAVVAKPAARVAPAKSRADELLASYVPAGPNQSKLPAFSPMSVDAKATHRGRPDPTPAAAWTLRGIDLTAHVVATPEPSRVEVSLKARDTHGDLVAVALSSDLSYGHLAAGEPFDLARLEEAPLSGKLAIPARKISDLPAVLGIPHTPGNVVLDVTLAGTMKQPEVVVDGGLGQLSIEGSPLEKPFAVKVIADYDGERANAHVALDQDGSRLMKATGSGRVAMRDLLHPKEGRPLPWTASADVRLGPLPLDVLEAVLPTKIDGIATGHIKLDDLHHNGSLDADVSVSGLVLGGIAHREALVRVTAKDGTLSGKVHMVQADGSLDADARVGIAWGERVVPELRATEAFDVGVRAKAFRLRAAEPFLTSVVNRLDGRLDGEVRLSKEALTDAARGRGVSGKLALSRGSVEVVAGGGPLDDVRAVVRVDDKGMVRLDDVFARGANGEVRAAGAATFGAAGFQAARLNVVIPQKKPMPLLVSGEYLADVSANVKVAADMVDRGRELRVGVDFARLEVSLPDSLPDGVQTLDDIEHVRIGTRRRGRFIPLAVDAPDPVAEAASSTFRTRVNIALHDARIVKGDMLSTYIRGNPSLLIDGDRTVMSGAVKLRGGRVDIKGRRFEIESGTITFTGDPANPDVILTAKWQAPDDTTIYADFVGPLATGKVNLRSDPPRSREEILALVIFGRAEGYSSGGQEADKGTQAVGMAGGFATEGLNKVLDDVTDLEIRTRVDTSSSTNPRPELEVQISQAIAARIAYVLGELAPGQSPDKTYATLDWNFRPEWSVETTVGDKASTTVDMIWERRY